MLPFQSNRSAPTDERPLRGEVKRITYRNPENGYCVMQLLSDEGEQVTVVGTSHDARVGSHLLMRGSYKSHPKFGNQFSASSIQETPPSTKDGLISYLRKDVKGIGLKTAQRLVDAFGTEVITIINTSPERIADVPGIGRRKAEALVKSYAERREFREVRQFFLERDLSPGLVSRILQRYKGQAVEIIRKDPFRLAYEMKGVGFLKADEIARSIGLKEDSPQRLKAGLFYALEKASDDGHCFLPREELMLKARFLLGLAEEHNLEPFLAELVSESYVEIREDAIYLSYLARAEDFVAGFIAERCPPLEIPVISPAEVEEALRAASANLGIAFSFEQEQAVRSAASHRLLVVTGGPGCGKTTITKALAELYRCSGKRLLLAAPTGRAAQRMSQVCGLPAGTIHRLLRFDPIKGHFLHGINQPLLCDALIIDEASMLDVQLAKSLFSAIPREATLILVGDKDQLPSVGPGRVFGDIISVRDVKTVALSQLFRRSSESTINSIAHMINSGLIPDIPEPDGKTKVDAYFIPKPDPEEALATIERLVADQIPKKFGIEMSDICVLTPSNRGSLGTQSMNQRLQQRINPSVDPEQEITVGNTLLRRNDRVCQRVNNYQIDETGVFNGDIGQIWEVDRKAGAVTVELWDGRLVKYSSSDLNQLSLAYAITVHRSQGSEIPCVVLALHESHYNLLERQLAYTAVTRAKRLLVVVGSKKALAIASKKMSAKRRHTLLRRRVTEKLGNRWIEEDGEQEAW